MKRITKENYLELMFSDNLTDEDRMQLGSWMLKNVGELTPKMTLRFSDMKITTPEQCDRVQKWLKKNK